MAKPMKTFQGYEIVDDALRKMVKGDYVTPQMFGAKADGVTDDSEAIRAAIAALPKKNGTLYFPPGVYIHGDGTTTGLSNPIVPEGANGYPYRPDISKENPGVGRDIRFYIDGYESLTILGYGAEIRSNDGNGETRNNAMFMFKNCVGVTIKGLKLDGRRQERGVFQEDYIPGPINDFLQCNITFSYGSRDILIQDVTSINSVHDGISIGWEVDNIKIINCVCDNAQRNGIAICGCKNVLIEGCQCNDNGVSGGNTYAGTGYRGIAPKCGIDIEGHVEDSPNVNVHVTNCTIERNNLGFSMYRWGHNISIEKCYIKDNPHLSLTDNGELSETYIRDCTIINSRLYSGFTVIENNVIEQHYMPEATLTNGYSFDDQDTDGNPEAPHMCRNNVFRFIVDNPSSLKDGAYMGIRLRNNRQFIGNKVIGAFSIGTMYPILLQNKVCKDNVFERGFDTINGIDVTKEPMGRIYYSEGYANGNYRENNDFGEYFVYGSKAMHREVVTDTSIKKSYSFNGNLTDKVYRIQNIGFTRIKAYYLGQEEEVVFPGSDFKHLQHILTHESKSQWFTISRILTVYQIYPYIYLKIHAPNPIFTASREMERTYSDYQDNFFNEDIMIDVTKEVNDGTITIPNNVAINMIRTYGDNIERPTYGQLYKGTTFFDTYIQRPIWWDGEKWTDINGDDATNLVAFTIDGKRYIATRNEHFASWVKSQLNTLRLREADIANGSGNRLIVSADGNKTLYIHQDGKDKEIYGNYGINELKSGGEYFFKDTPGVNPDYSNVPVFWNGTELVTTPIYNGEVE